MADEQAKAPETGNQQVQLGIGTMILIAIIVTMCSGKGDAEKARKDTAELRKQVSEINQKLDKLVLQTAPASTENVEAPADSSSSPPPPK
jgi:hypothetical protein